MVTRNCEVLVPSWLQSDLASKFCNAWVGVMGPSRCGCCVLGMSKKRGKRSCKPSERFRKFISLSRLRDWVKQISGHDRITSLRKWSFKEIIITLCLLFLQLLQQVFTKRLRRVAITLFEDYLWQCLERLESCSYFKIEELGGEEWRAYCYSADMDISASMMVQTSHRVFKYRYLKTKCNKRANNCLVSLPNHIRDKLLQRVKLI